MYSVIWSSGTIDSEMHERGKPNHIELINYIYRMDVWVILKEICVQNH
jgi:hypothetical protein